METDLILSFFSLSLFIWFVLSIGLQIYYNARYQKAKALKLLYLSVGISIFSALVLTLYTTDFSDFLIQQSLLYFVLYFILWNVSTVVSALIYLIYSKVKSKPLKKKPGEKELKKERLLNSSLRNSFRK
ncbi:MAG: hypothetical protein RBQ94_05700 [Methanimicrococcus sp.]|nr:hypothetical protein [Methanimicrococcus sp.]